MTQEKISFDTYLESAKVLFKKMFGEEHYQKLEGQMLKPFDWNGIDIRVPNVLVSFPNIKDRFTPELIDYFKSKNYTALDLFLITVFHFGYNNCFEVSINDRTIPIVPFDQREELIEVNPIKKPNK